MLRFVRLVGVALGVCIELIVGRQGSGTHHDVSGLGVVRQIDGQRGWQVTQLALALQHLAYRIGVRFPAGKRLADGLLERTRTVVVKQPVQLRDDSAQAVAPLGRLAQQRPARRRRVCQSVLSAVMACSALGIDQRREVGRVLDLLARERIDV